MLFYKNCLLSNYVIVHCCFYFSLQFMIWEFYLLILYVLCFHLYVYRPDFWSQWDVQFCKLSWPLRFRTYTALHRFRANSHVYIPVEWRWSISGTPACLLVQHQTLLMPVRRYTVTRWSWSCECFTLNTLLYF